MNKPLMEKRDLSLKDALNEIERCSKIAAKFMLEYQNNSMSEMIDYKVLNYMNENRRNIRLNLSVHDVFCVYFATIFCLVKKDNKDKDKSKNLGNGIRIMYESHSNRLDLAEIESFYNANPTNYLKKITDNLIKILNDFATAVDSKSGVCLLFKTLSEYCNPNDKAKYNYMFNMNSSMYMILLTFIETISFDEIVIDCEVSVLKFIIGNIDEGLSTVFIGRKTPETNSSSSSFNVILSEELMCLLAKLSTQYAKAFHIEYKNKDNITLNKNDNIDLSNASNKKYIASYTIELSNSGKMYNWRKYYKCFFNKIVPVGDFNYDFINDVCCDNHKLASEFVYNVNGSSDIVSHLNKKGMSTLFRAINLGLANKSYFNVMSAFGFLDRSSIADMANVVSDFDKIASKITDVQSIDHKEKSSCQIL